MYFLFIIAYLYNIFFVVVGLFLHISAAAGTIHALCICACAVIMTLDFVFSVISIIKHAACFKSHNII